MKATQADDRVCLDLSMEEAAVLEYTIRNMRGLVAMGIPWIREHLSNLAPLPPGCWPVLDRLEQEMYQPLADCESFVAERDRIRQASGAAIDAADAERSLA